MAVDFIHNPKGNLTIQTKPNETKMAVIFFDEKEGSKHIKIDIIPLKNSKLYVIAACVMKGSAELTLETHQIHENEYAWSDFLCKCALFDKSRFSYQGHIRISKKGQHSHAYQRNENLVLSDETRVISEPNLEILANDVFCTHGATTGYLNDVEMHYLQSRGLPRARAEALYTQGFLFSIIDKFTEVEAGAKEVEYVQRELQARLTNSNE